MGTVPTLAEQVKEGLQAGHPQLGKTVITKRALAVAALLAAPTPNTSELANVLPVPTEQQEVRQPWLRRLLKNPLLQRPVSLEPFARTVLREAGRNGQPIMLSLDQPELGDRFAILMLAVPVGERSLPLAWKVDARAANLGFAGQPGLLERVRAWLPVGATGLLLGDRFYPSTGLFACWDQHDGQYRLRLKGNLKVDTGLGEATPAELAAGVPERYLAAVRLFNPGVSTNLGMWQEAGHEAPWIIAMDCRPTRAAGQDYGARWLIEPTFSDFKRRGVQLEDTQLQPPDRLERLLLLMTLAMDWCGSIGRHHALANPTPGETKPSGRPLLTIGAATRFVGVCDPGSNAACAYCSDGCKPISPYPLSSLRS